MLFQFSYQVLIFLKDRQSSGGTHLEGNPWTCKAEAGGWFKSTEREFQDSQGYIKKPCLENQKRFKSNKRLTNMKTEEHASSSLLVFLRFVFYEVRSLKCVVCSSSSPGTYCSGKRADIFQVY